MIFDITKNVYREIDLHYWFEDKEISNVDEIVPLNYNFSIDWGDGGKIENYSFLGDKSKNIIPVSECKHTYKEKGTYRVNIYGEIDALQGKTSKGDLKRSKGIIKCLKGIMVPKGYISPLKYAPASFFGCEALNYLGRNVFDNLTNCKSVKHLFDGCKIKKIPNSLLRHCENLIDASYIFEACDIDYIPEDLFTYCPNLKYVSHAFHRCDYVTVIPDKLFEQNPLIVEAKNCFQACRRLTDFPQTIFDNCKNLIDVSYAVAGENTVAGYDRVQHIKKIPELWKWDNPPTLHEGFAWGCTEAENYDEVPDEWK